MGTVELLAGKGEDLAQVIRAAAARGIRLLATEHEKYRGAEVGGDACIESELGRAADIRVIRAENDDRVALPFYRLEA